MTNTIIFDIRDTDGDRENGVKTLPTELGVSRVVPTPWGSSSGVSAVYLSCCSSPGSSPPYAADAGAAPDLFV